MSRPASTVPPGRPQTRRGALTPTLIIVALIVVGFIFFANVWTDVLWYQQLGFFEVFMTENLARIGIFLTGFAVMFAAVFFAIRIAYHARPVYAPDSEVRDNLNRYQVQLEPVRRVVMVGLPILFGLFAGSAAASQWQKVLLFFNQEPFGQNDPQFGLDISFYLMTLPFLGFVTGFLISVTVIAGLAGILTHYLYGSIRIMERGIFTSRAAQIHLAVTGAAFLVLLGINFWLDRYSTVQNSGGRWAGALYTDVNAVIPTKAILAVAAAIVAVLFIVAAVIGKWRLPVIGTAMLIITAILAGGVYPWVIQQFQVRPSEQTLENPYIKRNIAMTRAAYGLDKVQEKRYNATTNATTGALAPDAQTTANIRLLDPNLISDAFSQLEQYRPYYQFPSALNVDRYQINGKTQDTVIAVRELNPDGLATNQQSWLNRHVVYTHGYGVVAAKGNKFTVDGKPEFLQAGIPTTGVLGNDSTYQPRIYFGQNSPDYSIVGAPAGAPHREQDRPAGKEGESDTQYTFTGNGGPNVGSFFNKILYAIKFQSSDLLLSDGVNADSQILYDRDPRDRVEKVAPYLTVDGNAYPAVVDGRVKWIVDGYTTSPYFPYSQQEQLSAATADSQTAANRTVALPNNSVNYIRNSVKATVDAYDGSVTLYAWDDPGPGVEGLAEDLPDVAEAVFRDVRCAHEPRAVPGGPVQGPARTSGPLPRDQSGRLLHQQRCVVRAQRPHRQGRGQAAALLHVAEDARPEQAGVPADLVVHSAGGQRQRPQRALRLPGRGFGCRQPEGREGGQLRPAQAPADPAGDPGPRPRPGTEQVQLRPHRFAGPQPAAPGCVGGAQRQPPDAAGGRRYGICPACLSAFNGRDLLPDAAAGPGGVRRQDRVRAHAG